MIYEIAKELKDAGFPQGGKGTWSYPPDALIVRPADRVYQPTLEELIKACGDNLFGIRRYKTEKGVYWRAHGNDAPSNEDWGYAIAGTTPAEAVARLWLEVRGRADG